MSSGRKSANPVVLGRIEGAVYATPQKLMAALRSRYTSVFDESLAASQIAAFMTMPESKQKQFLTSAYLTIERQLTSGSNESGVSRAELRRWVGERSGDLQASIASFGLIFEVREAQERRLRQLYIEAIVRHAMKVTAGDRKDVLAEALAWVREVPKADCREIPFGLKAEPPKNEEEWTELLGTLSERLYEWLEKNLDSRHAEQLYSKQLDLLGQDFGGLESFMTVVEQLPPALLSASRIQLLERDQLERLAITTIQQATQASQALARQGEELARLRRELHRAHTVKSESVREHKQVIDALNQGLIAVNKTGSVVIANHEAEQIWGCEDGDLIDRNLGDLLRDDKGGQRNVRCKRLLAMLKRQEGEEVKLAGNRRDGSTFPIIVAASPSSSSNVMVLSISTSSRERQTSSELAVRENRERHAMAIIAADHGLWDWDLVTDEFYASDQWSGMLGLEEQGLGQTPAIWFDRLHLDDRERVQADLRAHLEGRTPYFENEHRIRHEDGSYRWVLSRGRAVTGPDGKPIRLAGSQVDLTERTVTDALTGLPNRMLFMDRLGRSIERIHHEPDHQFCVLFVDLDGFKVINDSLGHTVGDQLLLAIAQRLEACVRAGDMVARQGGDEFTILLDNILGLEDARRVADRIQKELKSPFFLRRQEVFTSASIGIALGSADYERPDELVRDADTAMYRAKALGKARYEVFDSEMRDAAVALNQLHTDLQRAVSRSEFVLFYQPIVSVATGQTASFEALIRWQHPERGLVSPQGFISVAEETGIIVPIGRWVLRESCRQLREWRQKLGREIDVDMSVNISRRQFAAQDLAIIIKHVLEETEIEPHRLKLEITESTIMDDEEYAVEMLGQLRDLDVKLCIDDFGTGYSSLSALHRFPIDVLKIDRSFVNRMTVDTENLEIVRTIIILAHNLGMSVVAEGVETLEQLEALRTMNCDLWQGYYCTKPVPNEAAVEFIGPAPQALFRSGRRPALRLDSSPGRSSMSTPYGGIAAPLGSDTGRTES